MASFNLKKSVNVHRLDVWSSTTRCTKMKHADWGVRGEMQDDGGGGARIGLLEIGIAGGAVGLSIVVQV